MTSSSCSKTSGCDVFISRNGARDGVLFKCAISTASTVVLDDTGITVVSVCYQYGLDMWRNEPETIHQLTKNPPQLRHPCPQHHNKKQNSQTDI